MARIQIPVIYDEGQNWDFAWITNSDGTGHLAVF